VTAGISSTKIAVGFVVFDCLLAMVSLPLFVSFNVVAFWLGVCIGMRSAVRWWKLLRFRQRAQFVSDIRRVDYFRRVPGPHLENWLLTAFTARGFVLLGDPVLRRSPGEGFAWRSGKKVALFIQQERPLKESDLARIWALKNKRHLDTVFLFSPFSSAPKNKRPGLQILAGQELLSWMSVLSDVRPLNIGALAPHNCSCGAPQNEYVSCGGEALLICSRYPDCQEAPRPEFGKAASAAGK
jgi:hypothetical protein